jgi:hypothetical protein
MPGGRERGKRAVRLKVSTLIREKCGIIPFTNVRIVGRRARHVSRCCRGRKFLG